MELLVVIAILSVLITMLLILINPIKQLQKAKDAQRQHDISQVRNALDTYFNDNNCYPAPSALTIGGQFGSGSTVYMQKIPQDPDYGGGNASYVYEAENVSSCRQWNVLFAKLSSSQNLQVPCALSQMKDSNGNVCIPTNYQALGYNYCVVSGKVNCDYVTANPIQIPTLPSPTATPLPTPTPTSTSTPLPTPTPTPTSTPAPTPTPTPTPSPTPNPNCLCVNTTLHIANSTQSCQAGGYSQLYITFWPPVYAYFCPNGQPSNCQDTSLAATDCP